MIADEVCTFYTFDSLRLTGETGCVRPKMSAHIFVLVITKNPISMSLMILLFKYRRDEHCALGRSYSAFFIVAFIHYLCTNPHFPRDQDRRRALLGHFP